MKFFLPLFFLGILCLGQLNPKTKWGDVSQAEINYNSVPFEENADAVILYEKGDMTIARLDNQKIVYRRIKILNDQGKRFANQEFLYHDIYEFDEIRYIKAQSINLVDGKLVKTPVKNSEIYDTGIGGTLRSKRFAIPNVKVGTIIEIEYTTFSRNNYYLAPWEFQHEIPTLFSSFDINIQSAREYMPICSGEKIVKFARENEKIKDHRNNWTIRDVPSINKIDFVYNQRDAAEKIIFQLKGYTNINYDYVNEMTNWTDLTKLIIEKNSKNIDQEVIKRSAINISPGLNDYDQIEKVLKYVEKNYLWDDSYAAHSTQSFRELEKNKEGSSADLNLFLNQLLLKKGIKSELVLISLRDNGRVKRIFPFANQFSTFINLITLQNGETFFIDAIHLPEKDYKYIPLDNFNQYGLLLNKSKEVFIEMNPPLSEFQSVQNYAFRDGKYVLSRSEKRNGYFKKKSLENQDEAEKYKPQTEALDILTTEKKRDFKESDEENFELERIMSESSALGNTNFISVENPLKNLMSGFSLSETNRERALEFNFPFYYKTDVVIEIPDGFKVEIPQNFNVHNQTPAKDLVYFQSAEIKDGKLLMHIEFYLGKAVYDQNYAQIKAFFDKTNLDVNKDLLLKKN